MDADQKQKWYPTPSASPAVEIKQVRVLLDEAFHEVSKPRGVIVPREGIAVLRTWLTRMPTDVMQWFLPRILDDILATLSHGAPVDIADLASIIEALNVMPTYDATGFDPMDDNDKEWHDAFTTDMFANFTSKQACAITSWLRVVKSLPGLFPADWLHGDIDDAIRYWSTRGRR